MLGAAAYEWAQTAELERAAQVARDALVDGIVFESPANFLPHLAFSIAESYAGHPEHSHDLVVEAQEAFDAHSDAYGGSLTRILAAVWESIQGHFDAGRQDAEEGLLLARGIGNPTLIASAVFALG